MYMGARRMAVTCSGHNLRQTVLSDSTSHQSLLLHAVSCQLILQLGIRSLLLTVFSSNPVRTDKWVLTIPFAENRSDCVTR